MSIGFAEPRAAYPATAAWRAVRTEQMSDPRRLQPVQTSRRHPSGAPSPSTGPKSSSARNCTNVQVVAAIYRKKVASAWISSLSVVFVRGQALKLWRGTFAMNRSRVLIIYAVRCSPYRLWPLGDLRRRSDGLAGYRSRRTRGSPAGGRPQRHVQSVRPTRPSRSHRSQSAD
jgi:hypothetical protein